MARMPPAPDLGNLILQRIGREHGRMDRELGVSQAEFFRRWMITMDSADLVICGNGRTLA
jgi:hypothetical protein